MSASKFDSIIEELISDCPTGEIKEVYNDLLTIAGENSKDLIVDAIEKYNVDNFIPIEVDGKSVIISKYNKVATKFFDPSAGIQFSVDHLNRTGLDVEPCENKLNEAQELIHKELKEYTDNDYSGDAVYIVLPVENEENKSVIVINSSRYSAANFWNGQWTSEYIYDSSANTLTGSIKINVHYFEEGNVTFDSIEEVNESNVTNVVESLKQIESTFEKKVDVSFTELNEKQFKLLRRRLPVTRAKVNWGKAIGNYRIGKDAAQSI